MARTSSESINRELKPEQATAAHTLNRHVSVTAGPGAGKTFVLVERYLEILRTQKVSVDNIVAITFTNRAANEMRERVRKEIDELLHQTEGDERRRWLRHKRALEGAVITTIHGFCSRLLHEFPVEANIDPQFALLDEHRAAMMLEAVVEQSLTEAIQHNNEKIIQMAQGLGRSALAIALADLYREYRSEGLSLSEMESKTAANHAEKGAYPAAFDELNTQMALLLSAGRLSPSAEEKRARAAQEWPALRAILATRPDEKSIAAYCQAIEDFWQARPKKGSHPVVERLDQLLWGDKASANDCLRGRLPAIGFDLLAREYSGALLKLVRNVDERLELEKQRLSALDFDDLQLRALKLLTDHPEVMARIGERYRFFLVDEFQDTNGLQRDLMSTLALARGANLFIVGDRKQSIYGFRGADVDVFVEMTDAIKRAGGLEQPLNINFRSQPALIQSLNFLFAGIFKIRPQIPAAELSQLGYVAHEPSDAERPNESEPPLAELLVTIVPDDPQRITNEDEDADHSQLDVRERDALQLVERIKTLVAPIQSAESDRQDVSAPSVKYGDIAILFRALTGAWVYEAALRRADIPYLTVQGKGFYQREEVVDLIQLLRFLDNTTDELALAAVLRSPLCGISDDALLALRCAPAIDETQENNRLRRRNLLGALRHHNEIAFIDEAERAELDRAQRFLNSMIQRRNRYSISELLRYAVNSSELLPIIAANFDGAQRVANVEKLFRLAEQFEKSGNLIRDFVNYVEEFEAVGGREGEGQMDVSMNVVRLMTIHQAKGLEFPVVVIPDLHRETTRRDRLFMLDRYKGFTAVVPDGRGQTVRGALFSSLRQRNQWREEFESMRLLYVAATRAKDRLILSGAVTQTETKNLVKTESDRWIAWIWQALELPENPASEILKLGDDAQFQVTVDRSAQRPSQPLPTQVHPEQEDLDPTRPFEELFPLLRPIESNFGDSLRRFSTTQLINFQRCARQYYFERMLRAPGAEERAVWNDAEAPEPPANLTATLKGAVMHRFCETFCEGENVEKRLFASFDDVLSQRQAELVGRAFDIDTAEAVRALMPLAENYLKSDVFKRVSDVGRINADDQRSAVGNPQSEPGLWSELRFRVRRPLGILTGTIDKLLIAPAANGNGLDVEIIDFKTNRFSSPSGRVKEAERSATALRAAAGKLNFASKGAQGAFDFESIVTQQVETVAVEVTGPAASIKEQIAVAASDYQLQMQAYALALQELFGDGTGSESDGLTSSASGGFVAAPNINSLRATLHFLDPNVEISLPASVLEQGACARAIDDAMKAIASLDGTLDSESFPPFPATHCRMCKFLDLCSAGREWLVQNRSR